MFLQYTFAEHCYFLPQNMSDVAPLSGKFFDVETYKKESKRCPALVELVNLTG